MGRIDIRDVHKRFGSRAVLDGVRLSVEPGTVMGLLGANGAGKSTLISIATGLLRPDSGQVMIDGIDIASRRKEASALIGSAPQDVGIYPTLSTRENISGFARLHGLRGRRLSLRVREVMDALGLEGMANITADQLSGGQRRRLHMAMALAHQPRVLFLDEPTVGADVESRQHILGLVQSLADEGAAVLYTTHYLNEIEQLGAEVALLRDGTVTMLGSVAGVVEKWGGGGLAVRLYPPMELHLQGWLTQGEWLVAEPSPRNPGEHLAEVLALLGDRARLVCDVRVDRPTLEAAYLRLIDERAEYSDVAA